MGNETVETVYGSVEVDTVECESCGETILREDAYRFGMSTNPYKKINESTYNGYACEHCANIGPASFPERVASSEGDSVSPADKLILTVCFPVLAPTIFIRILTDARIENNVAIGYMYAFIGMLLWGLLTYLFIL